MNTYDRRLMEMLERVVQFGKKTELPLTTIITTLLAAVNGNLVTIRAWLAAQITGRGGYREAAAVRQNLKTAIYAVLQDLREIAKGLALDGDAGVSEKFRLPRLRNYVNILAAARSFMANATPMADLFIERGMPATFLADLQAKITAFDLATGSKHDGRADQVGSTAALKAAGRTGLRTVQKLRSIMRVHLRPWPELLAGWQSAARVERSMRKKPAPIQPPPLPVP